MILRLKTRESRSLPGLPIASPLFPHHPTPRPSKPGRFGVRRSARPLTARRRSPHAGLWPSRAFRVGRPSTGREASRPGPVLQRLRPVMPPEGAPPGAPWLPPVAVRGSSPRRRSIASDLPRLSTPWGSRTAPIGPKAHHLPKRSSPRRYGVRPATIGSPGVPRVFGAGGLCWSASFADEAYTLRPKPKRIRFVCEHSRI